jgi:hypothetical protein
VCFGTANEGMLNPVLHVALIPRDLRSLTNSVLSVAMSRLGIVVQVPHFNLLPSVGLLSCVHWRQVRYLRGVLVFPRTLGSRRRLVKPYLPLIEMYLKHELLCLRASNLFSN